ncbi:MAG: lysylphosphatidylglycerol synthase transmembrane domain-containing protein [Pseudomonadota bacterium]
MTDTPAASRRHIRAVRSPRSLRYGIGLLLLLVAVVLVYTQRASLTAVIELSWTYLTLSLLMAFAGIGAVAWGQKTVLCLTGVKVSHLENLALTSLSMMLNKVLPFQGGTLSRYGYLRHQYDMEFSRFLAGVVIWLAVSVFFAGLIGLAAVGFGWISQERLSGIFGGIFLAQVLAAIIVVKSQNLLGLVFSRLFGLKSWMETWQRFDLRDAGIQLAGPALLNCVFYIVQILVAFQALSLEIRVLDAVLAGVLLYTLSRWAITPGNLGVREMFFAATFGAMGYAVEQAISVAFVGLVAHLIAATILGLLLQSTVSRKLVADQG